jgi:hypothetical protein
MQIGPAQIGVDQKHSAILLPRQSVCKVVGNKSLALPWQGARDEQRAQRLLVANLIETRSQSPELLPHCRGSRGIYKNVALQIQAPPWVRAARPYVVEAKELRRSRLSSDFGMD